MRSGICSFIALLPLLAGLAERAVAAPEPAVTPKFKMDKTLYCKADGADGFQVYSSQDQMPYTMPFAGWEGVEGQFGQAQPFHNVDSDNLVECAKSCLITRKNFGIDQQCAAVAYNVKDKKCNFYTAQPEKIVIDAKFNNASSIALLDQICPENKIELQGGVKEGPCCRIVFGQSVIKQGL